MPGDGAPARPHLLRPGQEDVTLRVLASPELADLAPLLGELKKDTGIELDMEYEATADLAGQWPTAGKKSSYDLAWLASDRSFLLRLQEPGGRSVRPESTAVMRSPVVVGLTPKSRPSCGPGSRAGGSRGRTSRTRRPPGP